LRDISRKASSEPGSTNNKDHSGNEQQSSNGNGSSTASGNADTSSGNGSSGSNGNSGGGPRRPQTSSSDNQPDNSGSNSWLDKLSSPAVLPVLLMLVAAELTMLLLSFLRSATAQKDAAAALAAVQVGSKQLSQLISC
jgi:hypothetical protein